MSETAALLERLTERIAQDVVAQLGPKLIEWLDERRQREPDPLLTAAEAGRLLGVSDSTARKLVECGYLKRVPGLVEIRVRKSIVDAFATSGYFAERELKARN